MIAFIGSMAQVIASSAPVESHVIVDNFPEADIWAKIAAWVAIATFLAVLYQIRVGREELSVVKQDLANNKKLIDDAFQRPNLEVKFYEASLFDYSSAQTIHIWVFAKIVNDGERPSNTLQCELLVPLSLLKDEGSADWIKRTVSDQDYVVLALETFPVGKKHEPLFPNAFPIEAWTSFKLRYPAEVDDFVCLWRVYDEYARYPKEDYGQVVGVTQELGDRARVLMRPCKSKNADA
jgi:hypothetical protein